MGAEAVARVHAPAPVWITQANCLEVLGLRPALYLVRVRAWGIPADRDGKLVITELADWQRVRAERLAAANDTSAPTPELAGADALLASIGLERVRGPGGARR